MTFLKNRDGGNSTPTTIKDSRSLKEQEKSYNSLTQEIARLRASRTNLLSAQSEKPKELTPKNRSDGNGFKSITNYFADNFKERETDKDRSLQRSNFLSGLSVNQDNFFSRDDAREKRLSDQFPLSKIYEVQDLFYNVGDREFNELSSEY